MSWIKRHREAQERDNRNCAGRQDFPDSEASPRSEDCKIALYCVSWTGRNGKRTGNSWTSRRKAEHVRDEKIAAGTFLGTMTTYCAGFAF